MSEISRKVTVYQIQSPSYVHKKNINQKQIRAQTNKLQSKNPVTQIMEMNGNDKSSL